ncbi:MAG: HlyC/CorC family transporter [Alloprevotella sp.]|nr:HlyC/CorC family transporter [Alloprevotella sp.]MBR1652446.1 HlyC/CorC family transporter [Alloprevotella sp.]
MGLLLFYVILVLVISFSCSILEATLLSTPMTFVTMKEEEEAKGWRTLKQFKQDIDRPISAILTLNTIANTAGAAAVGFQTRFIFPDAPEIFGWVSAALTLLILVCSEIIPKTLGATYWRYIIMPAVPVIRGLVFLTWPFVKLAEYITNFISPAEPVQTVSREEVSALLTVGTEEGVFKQKEDRMIQNLLKLSKVTARDIMTPSSVVEMVEETMTVGEFREEETSKHSRIPVYRDNDDFVTGYVLRQHILESLSEDKFDLRLADIARPILSFNENDSVSAIWERMLEKKEHISAVIDEYGCLRGIVTMEDVIETMLGTEIVDENDTVEDMQEYAREQWKEQQKTDGNEPA